jgi:hypothetical protein
VPFFLPIKDLLLCIEFDTVAKKRIVFVKQRHERGQVMVEQNQLVQVLLRGHMDNQACNNVLWYRPYNAPGGIALSSIVRQVKAIWLSHVMPRLSDEYHLIEVEGKSLGGIRHVYFPPGPFPGDTIKTARKIWSETHSETGDDVGGYGASEALPSFCAYSVEKNLGSPQFIDPETGIAGIGVGGQKSKAGGMRIPGIVEASTVIGQPNTLTDVSRTAMQAAVDALADLTINLFLFGGVDDGKRLTMAVVSETVDGGRRVNKNAAPANQLLWTPDWVCFNVNSANVNNYVTSQVSRRRHQKRFQ